MLSVALLARLLETGQYQRCLEEAASLLAASRRNAEEEARIHAAICRSCYELTDYHAAIQAGRRGALLAEEAGAADLLGFVLADLAAAEARMRHDEQAVAVWNRYLELLPHLLAARCREGSARQGLGEALARLGQTDAALEAYGAARRWFDRFGDAETERACARAMIAIYLELGRPAEALPLLREGDRRPGDACNHLLDWAHYYMAIDRPEQAGEIAFAALERAGDRLEQQSRAQLLLCHVALRRHRPADALAFALAARVSAIDGHLYDLEFEAAEVIFRLLREHGEAPLREVAADFDRQGVNIYHYLSELAIRRSAT